MTEEASTRLSDSLIIDNMIVDGNYNAKQGHDAGIREVNMPTL